MFLYILDCDGHKRSKCMMKCSIKLRLSIEGFHQFGHENMSLLKLSTMERRAVVQGPHQIYPRPLRAVNAEEFTHAHFYGTYFGHGAIRRGR